MTTLMKLCAASALTLALSACATNDGLSDDQQFGVNDDGKVATSSDGTVPDSVGDKFRVGCEDDDQFEARGCDGIDNDGDGMDRDIYDDVAEMDDTPTVDEMTIAEAAASNPDLSRLVNALQAADLVDTLNGDGPFTVFAPTNAAFANLDASLLPSNNDELKDLLLAHVVPGRATVVDVTEAITTTGFFSPTTVAGVPINLYSLNDEVRISGARPNALLYRVQQPDVMASNGVIHIIDGILLPPEGEEYNEGL